MKFDGRFYVCMFIAGALVGTALHNGDLFAATLGALLLFCELSIKIGEFRSEKLRIERLREETGGLCG